MFSYGWLAWCMRILVLQGWQGWQDTTMAGDSCNSYRIQHVLHAVPAIRKGPPTQYNMAVCSPLLLNTTTWLSVAHCCKTTCAVCSPLLLNITTWLSVA